MAQLNSVIKPNSYAFWVQNTMRIKQIGFYYSKGGI